MKKRGSALGSSSSTDLPSEGSPTGQRYLVGRLGSPNGLEGFLGIYVSPDDLVQLEPGSEVEVAGRRHVVRALRSGKKGPQVAFEDVVDREGAALLKGLDVFVDERRALEDNEFWPDQLIGLSVVPGGGSVVGVITGGPQDRLVIERDSVRFEIPFVDDLVPAVDVDAGRVEIVEVEGLSSLSDRE